MIYVTIPTHNEARTLGVLLWKIRKVLSEFGRDYEIVVYDDASNDDTQKILAEYGKLLPLRVRRGEARAGYGAALLALLEEVAERSRYPKRDVAVTIQADFTEDPADLVRMVKMIEGGADLVAGALEGLDPALPKEERLARRFAPWVLGPTWRKAPVSDPISGLRAYRLVVLRKALRDGSGAGRPLGPEVWSANLELLERAVPHARRIEETPVRLRLAHRERPSRFRPWPALRSLFRHRGVKWPVPAPEPARERAPVAPTPTPASP